MVHQVFVFQLTTVLYVVAHAKPRLNAHKRRILAIRTPHGHAGHVETDSHHLVILAVEYADLMQLAVVELQRVVLEIFLGEVPHAIFGRYL